MPPPRATKQAIGNWSPHRDQTFPSGEEVLGSLQLDTSQWQRERVDTVDRELPGPDGQVATEPDGAIVLRRAA